MKPSLSICNFLIRILDDMYKLSKCVQIARLYLEPFDTFWKVCYARILDLKRKFLEAALRYYDISQIEKRQIGDE
ncbi:hypothetical protein GW17_00036745 [Ensete ventricosum]|nr:hypothetical protein GW17_00036745 [Ensete ventricosum]RZS27465.1 hypothetical protein BHM03_00060945 [Ensete ventricosum]